MARWRVDAGPPRAGRHYPRDWAEFNEWFDSEQAARGYLAAVRFRAGAVCPACGGALAQRERRWWCGVCRRWSTTTTGTLLEHTRVPIRTWLMTVWQLTATKVGLSALSLQRVTGVHYATAWSMLHRLRAAMDQTGRDRLAGDVEIDETFVGGVVEGSPGGRSRQATRELVLVACERVSDTQMGRIRLARAPDASALALARFIEDHVETGSVVITDGWPPYITAIRALEASGLSYTHKRVPLQGGGDHAHVVFPHVHRVASLLKRWLLGTHQGSVRAQHLDAYLDEFVFRFNRRTSRNRGLLFWRLLCGLLEHPPLTRAELSKRADELATNDQDHATAAREYTRLERRRAERERRYHKALAEDRPYTRRKDP